MEQEIVSWEKRYCWISYRPPLYREKKLNFGTAEESLFGFLWSFIWYWDCWLRGWCLSIIILVINSPRIKGDNTVHAEVGKLRPWTISLLLCSGCFIIGFFPSSLALFLCDLMIYCRDMLRFLSLCLLYIYYRFLLCGYHEASIIKHLRVITPYF